MATAIFLAFVAIGIPFQLIKTGTCEVEVIGRPRTRIPDFIILREEHPALTRRRLTITREMPPPRLIAEVISPGIPNHQRDAIDQRHQYAEIQVPEYWLIDPEAQTITVLQLAQDTYTEFGVFQEESAIQSATFGTLPFTANQILQAGK